MARRRVLQHHKLLRESFINQLLFLRAMVKRIGSRINKSRQKLSKNIREKSKISIRSFLQTFNIGDKVALKAEPAYPKGMYFLRFHGKTGEVTGQRGTCYEVKIRDFDKMKTVLVHPVHLKKVN